jgi:hypothetical protein
MSIRLLAPAIAGLLAFGPFVHAPTPQPIKRASVSSPKHDFLPRCVLPKFLNPRVQSRPGPDTASPRVEARVTKEDVAKWCAESNSTYPRCVEDRAELGGAADRYKREILCGTKVPAR